MKAIEILGPYDIVVEVVGQSVEEIYRETKLIGNLEQVASNTTYMSVKHNQKTNPLVSDMCLLIDTASADIEYVWENIIQLDAVQEADILLGAFDIVAMAHTNMDAVAQLLNNIRKIPGIIRVIAMPALQREAK